MRSGSAALFSRYVRLKSGVTVGLHRNASTGRWFRAAAAATNSQIPQDVWASTSNAIDKTWQALDEDLHREEAESPFALERAEAPTLRFSSGQLSVTFPVRQGVHPAEVKRELLHQLRGLNRAGGGRLDTQVVANSSEEVAAFYSQSGSAANACLTVHLRTPSLQALRPTVQFCKRGALSSDELAVFAAVLRTANLITADKAAAAAKTAAAKATAAAKEYDEGLSLEDYYGHLHAALVSFKSLLADVDRAVGPEDGIDEDGGVLQSPLTSPRGHLERQRTGSGPPSEEEERVYQYGSQQADQAAQKLQSLGAMVYPPGSRETIDWGILAGYADQKQQIEDTMLLHLLHPKVYENITKATRHHSSSNRPRAVLFEGPPGTGKTTSARVMASQAAVPLVYVPLEAVASKYYGESERLLAEVFKTAELLPGCIIFLDEVDSLATSRGSDMHEATRRLLGVLLRHLDGFETDKRSVVIAATNRKEDLDSALLSRFNTSVQFGLPDEACRAQILQQYAKHLKPEDWAAIAEVTPGLAGRDLKDISEQAERRWASKIIRKLVREDRFEPPVEEYIAAAHQRVKEKQAKQRRLPFPLL